ncbi:aldo/keto reductase [Luteitalea sp.]|uniref:aldo/keto reductase n=1 Tax=Luteitalea sp. TaxID=2004800 RepID=UPI0025B84034|nr:aldo/keto reductase [Luteitalea sp.]
MTRARTTDDTRRGFLRTGLAAGAFALFPRTQARAADLPLITKPIPSTGERLPVIGLGTIWYRDAQYAQLRPVLQRLGELGGTLIDTAAGYGESEGVIGRALAELGTRDRMFLATKFDRGGTVVSGPPATPAPGAPLTPATTPLPGPPPGVTRPGRDGIGGRESVERSLLRLRTDRIDLLQVHNMHGTDELMPLLQEWKRAGRIRYIGLTTFNPQQHGLVAETMRRLPIDFVQVDYSIGNRAAEREILPVAAERGVAVMANVPLGRATLLTRLAERPLPAWAADLDVTSWSQFLLKYVVSHPAVTCAIPGTTRVAHLEENMHACRGRLPDAAMRRRMEALWDEVIA